MNDLHSHLTLRALQLRLMVWKGRVVGVLGEIVGRPPRKEVVPAHHPLLLHGSVKALLLSLLWARLSVLLNGRLS